MVQAHTVRTRATAAALVLALALLMGGAAPAGAQTHTFDLTVTGLVWDTNPPTVGPGSLTRSFGCSNGGYQVEEGGGISVSCTDGQVVLDFTQPVPGLIGWGAVSSVPGSVTTIVIAPSLGQASIGDDGNLTLTGSGVGWMLFLYQYAGVDAAIGASTISATIPPAP